LPSLREQIVDSCSNSRLLNIDTSSKIRTSQCTIHASTIHSWAGMDDGRHESSEICDLLQNSVHYKQALHRILHCNVLILDEVSMLSKRLFERLSTICSLKQHIPGLSLT
jgi:ATP-dependent exoDNAse (exonuclease V) alpha subunit